MSLPSLSQHLEGSVVSRLHIIPICLQTLFSIQHNDSQVEALSQLAKLLEVAQYDGVFHTVVCPDVLHFLVYFRMPFLSSIIVRLFNFLSRTMVLPISFSRRVLEASGDP